MITRECLNQISIEFIFSIIDLKNTIVGMEPDEKGYKISTIKKYRIIDIEGEKY